jgi:hypothetical protein
MNETFEKRPDIILAEVDVSHLDAEAKVERDEDGNFERVFPNKLAVFFDD